MTRGNVARMKFAGVFATVTLLLAACGGGSDDSPSKGNNSDSANEMPQCSEVWVEGVTLPENYEGCLRGDTVEAGVTTDCSDGKGDLAYFDDKYMARLGGKIVAYNGSDDPAYAKEFGACTGT